eukprot:224912-Karenia_brevis.AAC.1
MARVKNFQNIVRHPEHCAMVLAAMFGKYPFETTTYSHYDTNPWLEQLYRDLQACRELDDMIDVCEHLEELYKVES